MKTNAQNIDELMNALLPDARDSIRAAIDDDLRQLREQGFPHAEFSWDADVDDQCGRLPFFPWGANIIDLIYDVSAYFEGGYGGVVIVGDHSRLTYVVIDQGNPEDGDSHVERVNATSMNDAAKFVRWVMCAGR